MKIGEFARKYNVSVATVRYYINMGLLVPEKDGFQYDFTENDCTEMEIIFSLKNSGFKLEELTRLLNLVRFHNKDDSALYVKLLDLLKEKLSSLNREKLQLNKYMHEVKNHISTVETKAAESVHDEAGKPANPSETCTGFPLNAVELLYCPHCHSKLSLSNVDIREDYISNGELSCRCGYHASIKGGILFTESPLNLDSDQQFLDSYFGRDNLINNEDGMLLIIMNNSSSEYMTTLHKNSLWIHKQLEKLDIHDRVILFPDISCQYLYSHYDNADSNDNVFIITALTERTIRPMMEHLANARPDFRAVYIVNNDGMLPLKQGCVDVIIDNLGTTDLGFFLRDHYLNMIKDYLSDDALIAGAFEYYKKDCTSLENIHRLYENASLNVFTNEFLTSALSENGFETIAEGIIREGYEPGSFFEYHATGDQRVDHVYIAKRNSRTD